MRRALELHPAGACAAVTRVEAHARRARPGVLQLGYIVTGDPAGLRLPPAGRPERTDELWRHTCFEAFIRAPGRDGYFELNIAPSGRWAAYRFTGYRQGMAPAMELAAPRIALEQAGAGLALDVEVDLEAVHDLITDGPWSVGLSAVIEAGDGTVSYWALAHPPGRPDFHHADCFALELPAPERP